MTDKELKCIVISSIVTAIGVLGAVTISSNSAFLTSKQQTRLQDAMRIIDEHYYQDIDKDDYYEATLSGVVTSLDKYSVVLTNDEFSDLVEADVEYGGIGVNTYYSSYNRTLHIVHVMPDTPADKAGLKDGDVIIELDGRPIEDITVDTLDIRGEIGSTLHIKVLRGSETLDFDIVRDHIDIENVSSKILKENIGYIKITDFSEDTESYFNEKWNDVKNCENIILDLRGNGGGIVEECRDILNNLVPKGSGHCIGLTSTIDNFNEVDWYDFNPEVGEEVRHNYIILVDNSTASCAEATCLILRELCDAKLLGEHTYGKGIYQTCYNLDKEHILKITTGWYISGECSYVDETGLVPDYKVIRDWQSPYELDNQMQEAINIFESMN